MTTLTNKDLIALRNSAIGDPRSMGLIADLTPEQCQVLAVQSLQRRMAYIFDLLDNQTLQAIARGEVDMAQACSSMLANRS